MWVATAFVLFLFTCVVSPDSKNSNLRLTQFKNGCPELKPISNLTDIVVIKNTVKFKAIYSEDVTSELKAEFTIERCLDKDSPSTCEKYHTLKIPYYCKVLSMGTWNSFVTATSPSWKCPFKKGIYTTKRSIVFDIGDVSVISIGGNYYWKVRSKIYLQDRPNKIVMCLDAEGKTYFS